jgi:hypothetical protein
MGSERVTGRRLDCEQPGTTLTGQGLEHRAGWCLEGTGTGKRGAVPLKCSSRAQSVILPGGNGVLELPGIWQYVTLYSESRARLPPKPRAPARPAPGNCLGRITSPLPRQPLLRPAPPATAECNPALKK